MISYPDHFTPSEKQFYGQALQISNLPLLSLLSESEAIALSYYNYAFSTDITVLFVDIGYCKTSFFAAHFQDKHIKILKLVTLENFGVREIDEQIYQFLLEKLNKLNVGHDLKFKVRLLEQIQKQRVVLSSIKEAQFHIEVNDNDFDFILDREQFNALIEKTGIDKKIQELSKEFPSATQIQLLGGGTRIPYFISLLQQTFHLPVQRNLNSEECVAQGCTLFCQLTLSSTKVNIENLAVNSVNDVFYSMLSK